MHQATRLKNGLTRYYYWKPPLHRRSRLVMMITLGLPHPDKCELYLVNRDTLFSYHTASEAFLFNMMSLFISSHYKNSPNDL